MKQLTAMLVAVTLIAGCSRADPFQDDLDRISADHLSCLDSANTLTDLRICQDILDRAFINTLDRLEAGYYDR